MVCSQDPHIQQLSLLGLQTWCLTMHTANKSQIISKIAWAMPDDRLLFPELIMDKSLCMIHLYIKFDTVAIVNT